jgi:hypothetical protein
MNVPRQCPLVLLVKVSRREVQTFKNVEGTEKTEKWSIERS